MFGINASQQAMFYVGQGADTQQVICDLYREALDRPPFAALLLCPQCGDPILVRNGQTRIQAACIHCHRTTIVSLPPTVIDARDGMLSLSTVVRCPRCGWTAFIHNGHAQTA